MPSKYSRTCLALELGDEQTTQVLTPPRHDPPSTDADLSPQIRIGTAHLDSLAPDAPVRAVQLQCIAQALTRDARHHQPARHRHSTASGAIPSAGAPLAVFLGDTNILEVSELSPIFSAGFSDAYAHSHGQDSASAHRVGSSAALGKFLQSSFRSREHATYATTFTELPGPRRKPRRVDYVLTRCADMHSVMTPLFPRATSLLGRERVHSVPRARHAGGHGGWTYPSDHLGVAVELCTVTSSR